MVSPQQTYGKGNVTEIDGCICTVFKAEWTNLAEGGKTDQRDGIAQMFKKGGDLLFPPVGKESLSPGAADDDCRRGDKPEGVKCQTLHGVRDPAHNIFAVCAADPHHSTLFDTAEGRHRAGFGMQL